MNVENKLAKVLDKDSNTLVLKAADRDTILNEISARMARYEKFDEETYLELKALRQDIKDIFNKGLAPGDDIMEQLYFLDAKTYDLVEKLSQAYERVITPEDFSDIAKIMSEHLSEQVPILRDFTKYFGRLAEAYVLEAKPSNADLDIESIIKSSLLGSHKSGYRLPTWLSNKLGWKDEALSEKFLRRIPGWTPDGFLSEIISGVQPPTTRQTGRKLLDVEIAQLKKLVDLNFLTPNKLPKKWTNVPWVNFDGNIIEQEFTQVFEERLNYKDAMGNWVTNILQIPQKTNPSLWEQIINKSGKIYSIVDAGKARTAFAVNG